MTAAGEIAVAVVPAVLGGAAGAAFINYCLERWRFKATRKAQKEDHEEELLEQEQSEYKALSEQLTSMSDELKSQISALDAKLDKHIEDDEEHAARACRARIQRFNDELLHGVKHTKDHFDSILLDLTAYDQYCNTHEAFKNNVTASAAQNIQTTYLHCMEERSFL